MEVWKRSYWGVQGEIQCVCYWQSEESKNSQKYSIA